MARDRPLRGDVVERVKGDLLLLHGFLGAPQSFRFLELGGARVFAPLLLGHSGSEIRAGVEAPRASAAVSSLELPDAPGPRWGLEHGGFLREVDRLARWARQNDFERGTLLGYSLGARLGLGLLARHPELFERAILLSVHPGLDGDLERAERLASDLAHCRALLADGVPAFVARWETQALFASQRTLAAEVLAAQRAIRVGHDARGLVQSLLACGLASMPNQAEALGALRVPVTLLTGELDRKFTGLARALVARHPGLLARTVPGAGHNLVLERPDWLSRALE